MTSDELIELLRSARESAGLSQRQLSALMGYSTAWVGRVENGRLGIQVEDISKWAETCGRRLDLRLVIPEPEDQEQPTLSLLGEMWPLMDERDRRLVEGVLKALVETLELP